MGNAHNQKYNAMSLRMHQSKRQAITNRFSLIGRTVMEKTFSMKNTPNTPCTHSHTVEVLLTRKLTSQKRLKRLEARLWEFRVADRTLKLVRTPQLVLTSRRQIIWYIRTSSFRSLRRQFIRRLPLLESRQVRLDAISQQQTRKSWKPTPTRNLKLTTFPTHDYISLALTTYIRFIYRSRCALEFKNFSNCLNLNL